MDDNVEKKHLPLRFCTGGLKCPYNLLRSIPYTENGNVTNNINQINLDIFVPSAAPLRALRAVSL